MTRPLRSQVRSCLFSGCRATAVLVQIEKAPVVADERLEKRPVADGRARARALDEKSVWRPSDYPCGAVRVCGRRRRRRGSPRSACSENRHRGRNESCNHAGDTSPDKGRGEGRAGPGRRGRGTGWRAGRMPWVGCLCFARGCPRCLPASSDSAAAFCPLRPVASGLAIDRGPLAYTLNTSRGEGGGAGGCTLAFSDGRNCAGC